MKGILKTMAVMVFTASIAGYTRNSQALSASSVPKNTEISGTEAQKEAETVDLQVIIDGKTFSAKLYNNETTKKLVEQMPITINMGDLNGNEKYYYMPEALPTDSKQLGQIKAGDIMLYGSDCLVLFYESFSSSFSYTPLGYFEEAEDFSKALGSGSVSVTFAIQ